LTTVRQLSEWMVNRLRDQAESQFAASWTQETVLLAVLASNR
jgi:hypothetical protein